MNCTCPICKKDLFCRAETETTFCFTRRSFGEARYVCRNCGRWGVSYFFSWAANYVTLKESLTKFINGVFFKVGQYPPLAERIVPELERRLEGEDLALYQKALRSRNFGYGIGAVAYLRRVVENRMDDLLGLIAQDARDAQFAPDDLAELENVRASKRFDEKVKYAAAILPPALRQGGHNPIERLHAIASEGIHTKSDDECIGIFDATQAVFEYFFRHFEITSKEREEFAAKLASLTRPKQDTEP